MCTTTCLWFAVSLSVAVLVVQALASLRVLVLHYGYHVSSQTWICWYVNQAKSLPLTITSFRTKIPVCVLTTHYTLRWFNSTPAICTKETRLYLEMRSSVPGTCTLWLWVPLCKRIFSSLHLICYPPAYPTRYRYQYPYLRKSVHVLSPSRYRYPCSYLYYTCVRNARKPFV